LQGSSSKNNNDGINYWKGNKILSLAEWRRIANSNKDDLPPFGCPPE
jgi:hypothetical protein